MLLSNDKRTARGLQGCWMENYISQFITFCPSLGNYAENLSGSLHNLLLRGRRKHQNMQLFSNLCNVQVEQCSKWCSPDPHYTVLRVLGWYRPHSFLQVRWVLLNILLVRGSEGSALLEELWDAYSCYGVFPSCQYCISLGRSLSTIERFPIRLFLENGT